ncbi:hypothetical protein [Aestuariibaculum suncheonense]|uniref:O-glycosyl hydrolase n=1 Tax=Aestuariibaculum suncheonense TaxID=1028745 RepID=A0A8J6Q3U3_9FLAO|nr:hypothetical protein [Aestuariibaculum suncheonense]MBD0833929.1 hypothetical protein [Aestuariibaculum suncheonense]
MKRALIFFVALIFIGCHSNSTKQIVANNNVTIYPDKIKQTVWGIGFEIQSDAIGSGNTGLPEDKHAVPHDLTKQERERFATEMLKGFRYCRIAGGLYWRGLDAESKYLQPRWPEQLEELREMIDVAGVEGVSLEYWSPAPFWKANNSYLGKGGADKYNTLRCFGPDFGTDPIYKGDTLRFLNDFAEACVTDLQTLKEAGIKPLKWGLQNEPMVSNNQQYSTCKYFSKEDYVKAYVAAAKAIRNYDPSILLISDTENKYPGKIGPFMSDPEVASLVDAYVVHTVGWDSESVKSVGKRINDSLPYKPWFQNEYEYLTGGATPERCLNTVQHIMNSFQIGENPSWYWIHALKPFKNSEASGYSLGFWKSLEENHQKATSNAYHRWVGGPEIVNLPDKFKTMEFLNVQRKTNKAPGLNFSFIINRPATAYMLVEQKGEYVPDGWELTDIKLDSENSNDLVYKKTLKEGDQRIAEHNGEANGFYGAPHAIFLESEFKDFKVEVGINSPIKIRSEALKLEQAAANLKPGHWIYNDFNWNAVGSFVKRMPWDCKVIDLVEDSYNKDARILTFVKPNGKHTIVVSNRTSEEYTFKINTGIANAKWKGYRYSPFERGENTMGVEIGEQKGAILCPSLPSLSWEFWEEE